MYSCHVFTPHILPRKLKWNQNIILFKRKSVWTKLLFFGGFGFLVVIGSWGLDDSRRQERVWCFKDGLFGSLLQRTPLKKTSKTVDLQYIYIFICIGGRQIPVRGGKQSIHIYERVPYSLSAVTAFWCAYEISDVHQCQTNTGIKAKDQKNPLLQCLGPVYVCW